MVNLPHGWSGIPQLFVTLCVHTETAEKFLERSGNQTRDIHGLANQSPRVRFLPRSSNSSSLLSVDTLRVT